MCSPQQCSHTLMQLHKQALNVCSPQGCPGLDSDVSVWSPLQLRQELGGSSLDSWFPLIMPKPLSHPVAGGLFLEWMGELEAPVAV